MIVLQVPFIVNTLWDALLDLDDLTASTNSIMTLLSLLLTFPHVRQCRSEPLNGFLNVFGIKTLGYIKATIFLFLYCSMGQSLTVLVPRVWPFLRHTISSVRKAALETLYTLLSKADEVTAGHFTKQQCGRKRAAGQQSKFSFTASFFFPFFLSLQSIAGWINPILQDMLRHIFQSCILESNEEILDLIQKVCDKSRMMWVFLRLDNKERNCL